MTVHAGIEYPDFDAFMEGVDENLLRLCRHTLDYTTRAEAYTMDVCPAPLLSATYETSVTRGLDLYQSKRGGALYNNTSVIGAGIGTAADACLAVGTVVYDKKMLTLSALAEILKKDFAGEETLRLFLQKKCPKYGTGDDAADTLAAHLSSVTHFDGTRIPNGCVADAMLHKSAVTGEDGLAAMHALLEYYMKAGGSAMHFNVLSADELRAAQRDPAAHGHLQVRLCGWNVRFIDLSPEEQEEFILRAEEA